MHNLYNVTPEIIYVGASDRRLALFESAFPIPKGVSYNAYVLLDEKTVLFDTVDLSVSERFFENLEAALAGKTLDYLVVHHMEPDHSATFFRVIERYPQVTVISNAKVASMLFNYFGFDPSRVQTVKEGDTLCVGKRNLQFVFAPMVHWPEVMLTYVKEDGVLFSADAFGTFGALSGSIFADEVHFERDFLDDARRYYFNIVGKYGVQVQNTLKKAAGLEIKTVCPLHGPVWRENFGWFLDKYLTWSSYAPEEEGVAIFYASVYGHTQNAAEILGGELAKAGVKNVQIYDVSVTHVSELLAQAFRYSHVVFASPTYNNGIFVNMENFINDLKAHAYQNRCYSIIENGSWAPQAGALMQTAISAWKGMTQLGEKVTLLSSVKEEGANALKQLASTIAQNLAK